VPDDLGAKGDLNDLLQKLGIGAVTRAIEDAEHLTRAGEPQVSDLRLVIGSDIEIAQRCIERLEELYGPLVFADGKFWRFDRTHWSALDDDQLARFVHRADGVSYLNGDDKLQTVKLNKSRVNSIIDAMVKYRHDHEFFAGAPRGINCESGFIQIDDAGIPTIAPHAGSWRQRHITRGHWPIKDEDKSAFARSKLAKYLNAATSPGKHVTEAEREQAGEDARLKLRLLGEVAGCVALGYCTKLRNPKAVILYSPEPNTGKSRFLMLVSALPNPEAVASVPPSKFNDEKYTYRLIGKVLNRSDELPDRAVRSDIFKRLITGEPVPARDLYKSATDFVPIAMHLFSTNVLPNFAGGVDGGVLRRLLPVAFDHRIDDAEIDPELIPNILRDEADLLLDFAVEGACRLIRQRDFTIPLSSRELLQGWVRDADPVRGWAADRLVVTSDENFIMVSELYADFINWAYSQGLKREYLTSAVAFGKRLRGVDARLRFDKSSSMRCCNARLKDVVS